MPSTLRIDALTPTAPLYILDSAQGLASNQVHRLARDAKSRILLATPVGLTRYDGSFIREWNRQNGLRCNGLRCVAVDAAQTIWIGSDIGLECISADGHAEPTLFHF